MTQQTYDTLYNKTIKDVTKDDLKFYKEILNINFAYNRLWFAYLGAMIIVLPLIVSMFAFNLLAFCVTIGAPAGLIAIANIANKEQCNKWVEELGISKQEFKDFKKSGGLKRIRNILKEYKKNPYNASNIYSLPSGMTVQDFETDSKKQAQNEKTPQTQNKQCLQEKRTQASYIEDIYNQAVENIEQEK